MQVIAEPTKRELLERALLAARSTWTGVALADDVFAAHVARHVPTDVDERQLRAWHIADMFLACACGHEDRAALAAFEATFMTRVPAFLARLKDANLDDVRQVVREKLMVGVEPADRKILDYSGQAPLGAWLKIVVANVAISMMRKKAPDAPGTGDDDDLVRIGRVEDPELDYIKFRYRAEFETAFRDALAELETRERNVLRLHFIDGLNIEAIGTTYRVHRATVARWIAASREKLFEDTRRLLRERLRLSDTEFESLVVLVRSRMDVTLRGLLG